MVDSYISLADIKNRPGQRRTIPNDDFQPENCWLIKNFENWATHFLLSFRLKPPSPLPETRNQTLEKKYT